MQRTLNPPYESSLWPHFAVHNLLIVFQILYSLHDSPCMVSVYVFSAFPDLFFSRILPLFCLQTSTKEWLAVLQFCELLLCFILCMFKAPLYIVGYRNPLFLYLIADFTQDWSPPDRFYLPRLLTTQGVVKSGWRGTLRKQLLEFIEFGDYFQCTYNCTFPVKSLLPTYRWMPPIIKKFLKTMWSWTNGSMFKSTCSSIMRSGD